MRFAELTVQEQAVLLATRNSENALSISQIAQLVEASIEPVQSAIDALCSKNVLRAIEGYTSEGELGTVYSYGDSDKAQNIYNEVHRRGDYSYLDTGECYSELATAIR